ncbi:hypothetical protein TNCV_2278861 [Trichonephila clavipes]|uniref:Uncharacterized protein n=1 Tax=Trichonephila clavipes TaxID=2585209 RepID=A0A8X6R4T4_TRICX|nr:hypothetical protein TNCV_2278861 [Trichonephila clavipes]
MAAVDFLHHEGPPTWAGVEPATLGAEGQRQTNYATQLFASLSSPKIYARKRVENGWYRDDNRTILRHFGNMFVSSLNAEISRSVKNIENEDTFRGRTEPIKGLLFSLKKDGWSPYDQDHQK